MKAIFLFLVLFLFFHDVKSQVKNTSYESSYYIEKVWSKTNQTFLLVETIYQTSKFILTDKIIQFKKGESGKWLQNNWSFDRRESTLNGSYMDIYFDGLNQKVIINYETNEIWYYHGPDPNTGKYNNLTIYNNLHENKLIINEYLNTGNEKHFNNGRNFFGTFKVEMNKICYYNGEKDFWSLWGNSNQTFILNSNANGDIIQIIPTGEQLIYTNISPEVEHEISIDGDKYQIINAIDPKGLKFRFQLFDNPGLGIKIIYENFAIEFAKFN